MWQVKKKCVCEDCCRKEEGVSGVCWFNVVFGGSY